MKKLLTISLLALCLAAQGSPNETQVQPFKVETVTVSPEHVFLVQWLYIQVGVNYTIRTISWSVTTDEKVRLPIGYQNRKQGEFVAVQLWAAAGEVKLLLSK